MCCTKYTCIFFESLCGSCDEQLLRVREIFHRNMANYCLVWFQFWCLKPPVKSLFSSRFILGLTGLTLRLWYIHLESQHEPTKQQHTCQSQISLNLCWWNLIFTCVYYHYPRPHHPLWRIKGTICLTGLQKGNIVTHQQRWLVYTRKTTMHLVAAGLAVVWKAECSAVHTAEEQPQRRKEALFRW